jgi:ABC-type dipeptide/oligopeptide/nickel transport system ATPase component
VGESGSGKTMTCLAILRLLPEGLEIKGGVINFIGRDILKMQESQLRKIRGGQIGIVFQDPVSCLNPLLKIKTQIQETLRYHLSLEKDLLDERTYQLLKEVEIPHPEQICNFYPHQLSGGLNQRVMIAQAISCNPKLLILDEPTSNLDATIQAQILNLFLNLKERLKVSILFITHNLGILEGIADRICIIKDGRILETGNFREVIENPKSDYTRRLLEAAF